MTPESVVVCAVCHVVGVNVSVVGVMTPAEGVMVTTTSLLGTTLRRNENSLEGAAKFTLAEEEKKILATWQKKEERWKEGRE